MKINYYGRIKRYMYSGLLNYIAGEIHYVRYGICRNDRTKEQSDALRKYCSTLFSSEAWEERDYPFVEYKGNISSVSGLMSFFEAKSIELAKIFIFEKYENVYLSITNSKDFSSVLDDFDYWFEERRNRLMERMCLDIAKAREVGQQKNSGQHGSVASLLKILTRTMDLQGADIRNIAKMQYVVCAQAGIYIPDEFLTDVAVVLDATGELNNSSELPKEG